MPLKLPISSKKDDKYVLNVPFRLWHNIHNAFSVPQQKIRPTIHHMSVLCIYQNMDKTYGVRVCVCARARVCLSVITVMSERSFKIVL
jgi:hypothetical protein